MFLLVMKSENFQHQRMMYIPVRVARFCWMCCWIFIQGLGTVPTAEQGQGLLSVHFDISEALECELGLLNQIEGAEGSLHKLRSKLKHMLVAML